MGGYAGTYFWVEPHQQLVAVLMSQATGPTRVFYRREFKQLVEQTIFELMQACNLSNTNWHGHPLAADQRQRAKGEPASSPCGSCV